MRCLAVIMTLAACQASKESDDAQPVTDKEAIPAEPTGVRHAMYVDDASALPACTPEAESLLVYVKAEAVFKTCAAGEWSNVDIKGEKGDTGEKGDPGEVIEASQPAPDGRLIVDAESKVIGVLLDPDVMTVRLDQTEFVLRLTSLEAGFSKLSDFSRCVFPNATCEYDPPNGFCLLPQVPLPGLASSTRVYIPDLQTTKSTSGWNSAISPALECDNGADLWGIYEPETDSGLFKFHPTTIRQFALPFRYLDQ